MPGERRCATVPAVQTSSDVGFSIVRSVSHTASIAGLTTLRRIPPVIELDLENRTGLVTGIRKARTTQQESMKGLIGG
jgi:hypothetical protein